MAHSDHQPKSKQHAQRRDVHRRYPLWVYDEDDWQAMRNLPVGGLICPKPDCRAELVTVELRKTGTRFLRNRPGTADCGHAFARSQGGGPPSAEHRWFQQRLAMLCDDLGYEAIQEHYQSRADVWVAGAPPLAIEVQRWNTDFTARTDARGSKGANVLWLLPESASSQKAGRELFRQPAARIRVSRRGNRGEEAKPWEPGFSGRVLLWVGATILRPSKDGLSLVSAGSYDAKEFLREVLEGERRWYGPGEPGFPFAGWARPVEVERMRNRSAAEQRRRQVERPKHPSPVPVPTVEVPRRADIAVKPSAGVEENAGAVLAVEPPAPVDSAQPPSDVAATPLNANPFLRRIERTSDRTWFQRLRAWLARGKA